MYAIVTPILALVYKYHHDGREMTFYTTHRLLHLRINFSFLPLDQRQLLLQRLVAHFLHQRTVLAKPRRRRSPNPLHIILSLLLLPR